MPVYCSQCGKESVEDANFCSACGRALKGGATDWRQGNLGVFSGSIFRTMVRPRVGRKVAGVCQGLANHYGWNVTVVRILTVLLAVLGFPLGLIFYGLIWLIAPEESLALPSTAYAGQQ